MRQSKFPVRLQKELALHTEDVDWAANEFVVAANKSGNEGAFLVDHGDEPLALPYVLKKTSSNQAGQQKPYICDFCSTWLRPSHVDTVTFDLLDKSHHTVSYRVCSGLKCNDNVRGLTSDGLHSRTQMPENITPEGRWQRFHIKLAEVVSNWASKALPDIR